MDKKYVSRLRIAFTFAVIGLLPITAGAGVIPLAPDATELGKYLMIGTGSSENGDAVNIQNTEIGADRHFLSDGTVGNAQDQGGPNLRDVFYQDGDRWESDSDTPDGAAKAFEGIDWSGNVAITAENGQFSMSDVDVYANIGVDCAANSKSACKQSVSNTLYYADGEVIPDGANIDNGINVDVDYTDLFSEMSDWQVFIESLPADASITSNIENENRKDGSGPYFTSFIDINGDGISVIDIDVGDNDFELVNSDWILEGLEDEFYIFRILNGSNFNLSNSSILLGDGGIAGGSADTAIHELGAIFYQASEENGSSDKVFNFNNVVLNGIGIWDFNFSGMTQISMVNEEELGVNNGQGCAQFISSQIHMNDIRFNRCALNVEVPEPGTLALLGFGLLGMGLTRRRKKV